MKQFKKIYHCIIFTRPIAFLLTFITLISASLIAIKSTGTIEYSILKIFIGALSSGFLASASHTMNNIFDLKVDKINKPFRPLPSKKISVQEAWIITFILYLISFILFILAFTVNRYFFIIMIIIAIFTIIYSCPPFNFKRFGIIGNLTIAIPRGLLIMVAGWSIVTSIKNILPWYMGLIPFLFLVGAVTTKDIADIKGDKKLGYITLPVKYGLNKTIKIITPFLIIPFFFIPLGVYLRILKISTLPLTLLFIYGIYIIMLIKKNPNKLIKFDKLAINEKNHISWKHTYFLYLIYQIGMAIAYLIF
jgi:geranylgeranylglycerol-phosphate geranylgeranyltransferase